MAESSIWKHSDEYFCLQFGKEDLFASTETHTLDF